MNSVERLAINSIELRAEGLRLRTPNSKLSANKKGYALSAIKKGGLQ